MTFCKTCNDHTETSYSESRGEKYCTRCGAVLEENCIVEAVTFTEGSNGVVRANGQFIPSSGFGTTPLGFSSKYDSRAGREQTLQRGYANIQRIANRLHLSLHLVEAAQRIYLMGVQRNFTLGRITSHVAAACLYTSCRRERTQQLLIDFSDVLCTPVRILGRVFVKLIRLLRIDVPTIDPSLFMERFASQMDLENKTNSVVQTAVRLVQAMTRDWICTGRRPTGLCGAALLIAARFHGFKVNAEEISRVIRMASSTVARRLSEFKHTSTAQLTLEEFESLDLLALPILRGPPCVETPRKSLCFLPEPVREVRLAETSTQNIDVASNNYAPELLPDVPKLLNGEEVSVLNSEPHSEQLCMIPFPLIDVEEDIFASEPTPTTIASLAGRLADAIEQHGPDSPSDLDHHKPSQSWNDDETFESTADLEATHLKTLLYDVKKNIPSLMTSLSKSNFQKLETLKNPSCDNTMNCSSRISSETNNLIEESLTDVSDTEIDSLILNDKEREAKTLMWDEIMKHVMPQVHRRIVLQRRHEELAEKPRKTRRRFLSGFQEMDSTTDMTTAESIRLGLESKNPSFAKQLNESVLESLFSDSNLTTPKSSTAHITSPTSSLTVLFT